MECLFAVLAVLQFVIHFFFLFICYFFIYLLKMGKKKKEVILPINK